MGNPLTGNRIRDSYTWLLQVGSEDLNELRTVCLGNGIDTPIQLQADGIKINGDLEVTGSTNLSDLEQSKTNLFVLPPSGDATTDLANINAALLQAKTEGKDLVLDGEYFIDAPWVLTDENATQMTIIFTQGSSITQTNALANGIEFSEASRPNYISFKNLTLIGVGATTSAGSAIFAERDRGALYFGGDYEFKGGSIRGWATPFDLKNVSKVSIENLECLGFVTAFNMNNWNTYTMTNVRAVNSQEPADVSGSMVFLVSGDTYGGKITMGEFGGLHTGRLAAIDTAGCHLNMEGCNVEGTFEDVGVLLSDGARFTFTNGRYVPDVAVQAGDNAFVSVNVSGDRSGHVNLTGSDIESPRHIEYHSGDYSPYVESPTPVVRTDGEVGNILKEHYLYPRERYYSGNALPMSAHSRGERLVWSRDSNSSESWMDNHLLEVYDNIRDTNRWVSTNNDFLMRVLAVSNFVSAPAGSSQPISATVDANAMVNRGASTSLRIAGKLANNSNTKRIQVTANGVVILDSGDLTTADESWKLECHFQGDNSAGSRTRFDGEIRFSDGTSVMNVIETNVFETIAMDLDVTIITTSAGDVETQNGKIKWERSVDQFPAS